MDYLAMMKEALAAADNASQTADNREGNQRRMWLETADKFMGTSRMFALASIAESLADIAEKLVAIEPYLARLAEYDNAGHIDEIWQQADAAYKRATLPPQLSQRPG